MEVRAFQYLSKTGWSVDQFPNLDSEQTFVLIFAAPEFLQDPQPIKELANTYKKAKIFGCSSAGEIFDVPIFDYSLSVVVVKLEKTKIKIVKAKVKTNE